jgi:large subunit ribosomal protein L9
MKIILKQSVDTLGKAGDIVQVKSGYGRNYLIPKGLGVLATPSMINATMQEIERKAIKEAKSKENLEIIANKLNTIKLTFALKAGEDDKLFGSVTTQMISDSLNEKGYKVDKKYIAVDETIKALGNYSAIVDFGDDISAKVKLKVIAE